jgi:hypothetical protein
LFGAGAAQGTAAEAIHDGWFGAGAGRMEQGGRPSREPHERGQAAAGGTGDASARLCGLQERVGGTRADE